MMEAIDHKILHLDPNVGLYHISQISLSAPEQYKLCGATLTGAARVGSALTLT